MNHQPPPLIALPLDLTDEAVAKLIEFLHEITQRFESHYADHLCRNHNAIDERQPDLWSDTDPPFSIVTDHRDRRNPRVLFSEYPRLYAADHTTERLGWAADRRRSRRAAAPSRPR